MYMPTKMAAARLVVRNLTPVDKAFSIGLLSGVLTHDGYLLGSFFLRDVRPVADHDDGLFRRAFLNHAALLVRASDNELLRRKNGYGREGSGIRRTSEMQSTIQGENGGSRLNYRAPVFCTRSIWNEHHNPLGTVGFVFVDCLGDPRRQTFVEGRCLAP